jgi:hypothetical protein
MNYEFTQGELPILISSRVRINDQERQLLKSAYRARLESAQPAVAPSVNGSSIGVVHQPVTSQVLDTELGMGYVAFTDLVNSRDSISLPLVLKMQAALGVEVVTRERLQQSTEKYIDYVMCKYGSGDA